MIFNGCIIIYPLPSAFFKIRPRCVSNHENFCYSNLRSRTKDFYGLIQLISVYSRQMNLTFLFYNKNNRNNNDHQHRHSDYGNNQTRNIRLHQFLSVR